jgi:hypothetical protein
MPDHLSMSFDGFQTLNPDAEIVYPNYMKDKILNTNRDVVNGANKSKENCNLISDGFFRNACTKSGSLRFSQFSGC